jgi:glycosyltransferase involved in cell wall biosynthesis
MLQVRGHNVRIVTNQHPSSLAQSAVVDGLEVSRLPFTAPSARVADMLRFAARQLPIQRSLDAILPPPDIVHIQCPSVQTAPLALYARRHRIPLVLTSQGEIAMDANRLYERSLYARLTLRVAARAAAALTACSHWTAAECVRYSRRFAHATVIPNGVNVAEWDVGPLTDKPVLCAWGRHVEQKGFDLAIGAFALLRQRIGDARLVIGGDGVETPRLQAMAGAGVEFVGPLDRGGVRALLAQSRVAVVPSRVEPFGIVALETLAAGRGLVYADGTGLAEAAGALGRSVDVHDAAAFATAMEAELLQPCPQAAGRDRAERHSWVVLTERYLRLYAAALP